MKHFFLIGANIAHSPSPQIHNQIYNILGINASYGLMQLPNLEQLCTKAVEADGFNITSPFKSKIISLIHQDFSQCGSVNTVKITKSKDEKPTLEGHSTDGKGFILDAARLNLNLKNSLIVGFGGAAKSICHQLKKLNNNTCILSSHLQTNKNDETKAFVPSLIINCSGNDLFLPPHLKKSAQNVPIYDLRYSNLSKNSNFNGLGMLVYQAILSEEIFLNQAIDLSIFDEIYKKLLKERA